MKTNAYIYEHIVQLDISHCENEFKNKTAEERLLRSMPIFSKVNKRKVSYISNLICFLSHLILLFSFLAHEVLLTQLLVLRAAHLFVIQVII